jgi:hypothetical protein
VAEISANAELGTGLGPHLGVISTASTATMAGRGAPPAGGGVRHAPQCRAGWKWRWRYLEQTRVNPAPPAALTASVPHLNPAGSQSRWRALQTAREGPSGGCHLHGSVYPGRPIRHQLLSLPEQVDPDSARDHGHVTAGLPALRPVTVCWRTWVACCQSFVW